MTEEQISPEQLQAVRERYNAEHLTDHCRIERSFITTYDGPCWVQIFSWTPDWMGVTLPAGTDVRTKDRIIARSGGRTILLEVYEDPETAPNELCRKVIGTRAR